MSDQQRLGDDRLDDNVAEKDLAEENQRLREALEDARGWVVTHVMQTHSRAASDCVKRIDAVLSGDDA